MTQSTDFPSRRLPLLLCELFMQAQTVMLGTEIESILSWPHLPQQKSSACAAVNEFSDVFEMAKGNDFVCGNFGVWLWENISFLESWTSLVNGQKPRVGYR